MNFPIAERELRVLARSPRVYFGRIAIGVVFFAINGWLFWAVNKFQGNFSTQAAQTFAFVTHIAMIMMVFNANTTADAISSEKRGGTLGLLFLTDLKSFDIVLGKLMAHGLTVFYSVLGLFPILAMTVLMGGIPGSSLVRTFLALINALFFALSMGLWISARNVEQKRATNTAAAVASIFLWGLPALSFGVNARFGWVELSQWILFFSPTYQIQQASPLGASLFFDQFWLSFLITNLLGWFALWRACRILPQQWQDKPAGERTGFFAAWKQALSFGKPAARLAFRQSRLALNPIHWLSARRLSDPLWTWSFMAIILVAWFSIWAGIRWKFGANGPPFWGLGFPACFAFYLGLRIRSVALAAEVIARDRASGALELLLSTTLTEKDFARGQWRTFRRSILGPAIFALAVFILNATFAFHDTSPSDDFRRHLPFFAVGISILFITDLIASVWTGLWMGCITKTPNGATGLALLRLLVLPWSCMAIIMTFFGFFEISLPRPEFYFVFSTWFSLCLVTNIVWSVRSRREFYERLRFAAAERYQPQANRAWWRFF
jgi:ABC-type transport system involved in multi-copper enzyme maturation permease subunit